MTNRAVDLPIVSLLNSSSDSSSSAPTGELEIEEACGRAIMGPPSATVYRFLGVGLTLAGRSPGLLGGGSSLEGETDDMDRGSPDDRLPYDEAEDD